MTDIPELCNLADILEISKLLKRIGFHIVYPKFRHRIVVKRRYTGYLRTLVRLFGRTCENIL